jgi:hypothetical protein
MSARRPIRLLLTCRDPNGAHQMLPLHAAAVARGGFEPMLLADGVALSMLRQAALPVREAAVPIVEKGDAARAEAALARAAQWLRDLAPDVVIAGLSGPAAGVDEAIVAAAAPRPTFVLQDFWGDVNLVLGTPAQAYFVLDESAKALTSRRAGAAAYATGMPKFEAYARLDPASLRRDTRRLLSADEATPILSFFGQPLWNTAGYREAVESFVRCAAGIEGALIVLRRHPCDESGEMERLGAAALRLGARCRLENEMQAEAVLAASDLSCSAFSSCCHDAIMLSRRSRSPLGLAAYYLPPPQMETFRSWTGLDHVPPVGSGVADLASTPAALSALMQACRNPQAREAAWRRAQSAVPPVEGASARILDLVVAGVSGTEQAA